MKLRRPAWASRFAVKVNGQEQPITAAPGSFVELKRTWHSGDRVSIEMPYPLRTEAQPDRAQQVALLHGPVVLAGEVRPGERPIVFVAESRDELLERIEPADAPSHFRTRSLGRPDDVALLPFFQAFHQHYAIYFDVFSQPQWQAEEARYRAEQERLAALAARTIDAMTFEMQPERDHELTSENSRVGQHLNRKWRDAWGGGWFEFSLAVDPQQPNELVCTWWGGESERRVFDIFVDGQRIATQTLHRDRPGEFFDVSYAIPPELTRGREKVRVRMAGQGDSIAGGCFGVRMLRAAK